MVRQSPRRAIFTLLFLMALPAALASQTVSSTTGAINGKVIDKTSAVLPGVTVTIASPSMMGTRNTVTAEDGMYRFAAIPPGEYKVTFELTGFQTLVREGIRVTLGFTATVNGELGVASLSESVTVTGQSPVVDTSSTAMTTNFDAKQLASLPNARDLWAILAESPGVALTRIDVGGSAAGTQTGYSVYGTSGQNRPMVEGIVATEGTGAAGFYYDYGSFDEVSVETAAHSAEMPWPGVQSQFISKSGGNTYHGGFYGDYERQNWQAFNVDADQIARGAEGGGGLSPRDVNRLSKYHDVNADIGGYLKKDKTWWYFSTRDQDVSAQYVNFPVLPHRTRLTNVGGKGTWQLSQNNKLIAYAQAGRKHQPTRLDPFGPAGGSLSNTTAISLSSESTWEQLYWGWVWKGEWNSVISNKLFFEVRAGQFGYNWPNHPNGTGLRYEDIGNNIVRGANRDWRKDRRRNQVLSSVSYFKDGWAGTHNFKFGGDVFDENVTDTRIDQFPGDLLHVLRNGAPIEVYLFNAPSKSIDGLWTYSAYANDTWRVTERLTLNVGLRFDRYREYLPAQELPTGRFNPTPISFAAVDDLIHWNLFAPRVGATFNVTGDGKTAVKFNYGQYWFNPGADFSQTINPNSIDWWKRYAWTDSNINGKWDPGEQGALLDQQGGSGQKLDPELRDTFTRETAVWFERELMANVGVRTGFIWRGERQHYSVVRGDRPFDAFNIPTPVTDPGPDGRLGTSDDGGTILAYALAVPFRTLTPVNLTTNNPNSDSNYYTWEISGTKRLSNRWSMLAAFGHTWSHDQGRNYFGNSVRQNTYPQTPNDLINAGSQGQYVFRGWGAKLHGTWEGPRGLRVTPILRHQAGQPYARTFTTSALGYGSVRIIAEPINRLRQDNITLLDLRLEKAITLKGGKKLSPFMDLFNVFNANQEQNISWNSGTFVRSDGVTILAFQRPTTIVPPRILRIGAKFTF